TGVEHRRPPAGGAQRTRGRRREAAHDLKDSGVRGSPRRAPPLTLGLDLVSFRAMPSPHDIPTTPVTPARKGKSNGTLQATPPEEGRSQRALLLVRSARQRRDP